MDHEFTMKVAVFRDAAVDLFRAVRSIRSELTLLRETVPGLVCGGLDQVDATMTRFEEVAVKGFWIGPDPVGGNKPMKYVMPEYTLSPELQSMKDRMDRWTPEQWAAAREILRRKFPELGPPPEIEKPRRYIDGGYNGPIDVTSHDD